ncbi:MAG: extracellular solute-binding protein [Clostridiaceae bacterium]|nr:extracellular solute-binding protein [Clostridiaceae bacterium]
MKRFLSLVICLAILTLMLSACGNSKIPSSGNDQPNKNAVTDFTFWTYQELHAQFFKDAAQRWNAAHPDEQINIKAEAYPVEDMHSKLLITLQSGQGAPDIVDINVAKFSNFMKSDNVGLVPLNDIIEKDKGSFLEPVLDIYKKGDTYYGIEYHVGAPVMYYNTEILDQAGVKVEDIKYWSDLREAGKKVLEKTGKPIITFEISDSLCYYIMVTEQKSDYFADDGQCIIDNETNVNTLQFMLDMINEGTAIPTPGGSFHSEEYYGFMSKGGAASMLLPLWYMGRFTDYMPELKGKVQIAPIPKWKDGDVDPVFGGTATSITTQCKNPDLAKRYLFDAKISAEGASNIWSVLGFDPLRWDIWNTDVMKQSNKYTDYFGPNIFDIVLQMKDNFYTTNITHEQFPLANQLVAQNVLFKALGDKSLTPAQALNEAATEIKSSSGK